MDRMREMFAHQPEPLRATGTDDTAVENSEFARSAQDAKPCVSGATGCDDEAFKPPAKKAPKPLCIADLGEEVQASATDCENSGGGTRTCGPFVFDLHFAASTAGVGVENRGALNAGQCTGGAAKGFGLDAEFLQYADKELCQGKFLRFYFASPS